MSLFGKKDNSGKIIGTGAVPEKNRYLFEEAPQEFLVAIGGGSAYGSRVDGKFSVSFPILGYVNLETGKKSDVNANLSFVPTKEEEENNEYFNVFNKLKIYRIKAMAPKRVEGDAMVNNEFRMSSLYALELLESNVSDEFLEGLIEKYNAPVVAKSELLGEFVLDKDLDLFCGKCDWLGDEADASINVEEGQETVDEGIKCLEAFYNDRASWDKKMREYAAGELTDLANEWQSSDCDVDEDGEPIDFEELTEEDFASRLEISSIEMGVDGNFTVYYDDGDMFFGHSIVVEGSLNEGVNYADMMG